MDNVASAIVGPVASVLTGHITQKLRNLTSSADRVKEMKDKMKFLDGQRIDNENHLRRNRENNKEIPARVPGWLEEVENIKKEVENIPSNDIGCFNVEKKYLAGRNALRVTKDIEGLMKESSDIIWSDAQFPLGRVDSKRPASTSTPGGNTQIVFKSRDNIFDDALKFLQQDDDKTRVIALCGMGGVGKTTLMKQLKKAAHDNKIFKWIVVVVVGKSSNLFGIQNAIAAHTGEPLTETDERLRATRLSKRFRVFSEHKEKILVILDDLWEKIKLEDIGLAGPLPNGVKLLLTSRDANICRQIAVDVASVLKVVKVDVLEEGEARDFFCQKADISPDHDLYKIGCEIVKKCGGLPLAIKLIAATLNSQNEFVWRRTLKCLENNDLDENVQEIIEISYNNLKQEDKEIFRLCGLFPEDSNIPIEDLTRYAWGLKLLNKVYTMEDARDITQTSVSNLKNVYLLMDGDSDDYECVKMHDLVLAFVVATVSKGGEEGYWIIHHEDDFSKWSEADNMSQSCKQLSLTCKGMSEFPSEFQFPNLSLLKLMHGNESLRFHPGFYEGMEQLQVIAFKKLEYPLVPTSDQFSPNLRTLCLHECSLKFDLACIGNLSNLEVLSFANSGVTILPSTFGNLKKLRLLDVTGCYNLVIDDGVFKNLVKLEELYMIPYNETTCCFTDGNGSELAERSKNLSALEFEFIGDNAHLKNNMSFKKLERFKLSVGCYFDVLQTNLVDAQSYQNSLYLVTNRDELLKSKIRELFENTDELYLRVNDMNTLEDVDVESPRPAAPGNFNRLRVLVVSKCAELTYLFTPSVATMLPKLEDLEISGCPIMEAVCNGSDLIKFPNLKYLRLAVLPKLLSFSNNVNVIKLPRLMELQLEGLQSLTSIYPDSATSFVSSNMTRTQSFLNSQDATPKLEKLFVSNMENLKEVWPRQFSISNLCPLRELTVKDCGSIEVMFDMDFGETEQPTSSLKSITVEGCSCLVKLFSCNPFPFLNNLQELNVKSCGSIQVLFNTDLGRAGKSEEQVCSSSLRSIEVSGCDSLVNLFPSNPMSLFNNLEWLTVTGCASIEVIFDIDMRCVGELGKLREVWRIQDAGNNLIHGFEALESIDIRDCERFKNLITPATTTFDMRALKEVRIINCGREKERSYELVESNQDQENNVIPTSREEVNDGISKVALPSSLLHTFHHLHNLLLEDYKGVEVVFEITTPISRESPHNTQQPPILPYLEKLELENMGRMSHVWKCNWNEFLILQKPQSQSSFHNLTTIEMHWCNSIKYLFSPLMAKLLSNLKKVDIWHCDGIEEIVSNTDDEDTSVYSHTTTTFFPHLDILDLSSLEKLKCIGGSANGISTDIHDQLKLSQTSWSLCQYTREISIADCDALSSVVPWYAVGQMQKLQVLKIEYCESMTEVFETQEINKSGSSTRKSLPRLEYITMLKLPKLKMLNIKGCNLLKHIFTFSTFESLAELEELEIQDCEAMEVIVKKNNGEQTTASDVVVFPRLKSLSLVNLPNFVGFFLGKNEFIWPTLEKVVIRECPQITVFTYGQSTAPMLNFINSSLGKHSVECDLNFHVTTTSHQARLPSSESSSSYRPTTMERLPWSYHNLIEVNMSNYNTSGGQTLFSSDKLLQLQKLETVHCSNCRDIEEIFDSQTVAEIPNLRQVDLERLSSLKYIWKSKQGTVLKFLNLTRLSIRSCHSLEYVFTCPMVGSLLQLQELHISDCYSMKVIVKGEEEEECNSLEWKSNHGTVLKFPNLTRLSIRSCHSLEYVFTRPMVGSLLQLQELHIRKCYGMKVIVKGEEEECDAIVNAIVEFPCLKSLKLEILESLEGFWLGKEAFEFPSLDTMEIKRCPEMTVFTKGDLSAPKLYAISKGSRKYNIHNRLNSVIKDFNGW